MQRFRMGLACLIGLSCLSFDAWGKDANALAALTRSAQALGLSQAITGVSVQGNASYTAGSDVETVAVTFAASGFDDAQLVLQGSTGAITEVRHKGQGSWTGPDGTAHAYALHNTWSPAAWFSPSLLVSAWTGDPELMVSDIGPEQRNGAAVEHLQCYRVPAGQMDATTASLVATASRIDLYLDSTSWLPIAVEFNRHPDANQSIDLPVRVEFSNYQSTGSGTAPFRLQEFLQNNLLLDLTASSINLNAPPLPSSSASPQ